MLRWHMTFERKLVEQSVLPALTFPHHRQHSNPPDRIESPPPCPDNSRFFQHNRTVSGSSSLGSRASAQRRSQTFSLDRFSGCFDPIQTSTRIFLRKPSRHSDGIPA